MGGLFLATLACIGIVIDDPSQHDTARALAASLQPLVVTCCFATFLPALDYSHLGARVPLIGVSTLLMSAHGTARWLSQEVTLTPTLAPAPAPALALAPTPSRSRSRSRTLLLAPALPLTLTLASLGCVSQWMWQSPNRWLVAGPGAFCLAVNFHVFITWLGAPNQVTAARFEHPALRPALTRGSSPLPLTPVLKAGRSNPSGDRCRGCNSEPRLWPLASRRSLGP